MVSCNVNRANCKYVTCRVYCIYSEINFNTERKSSYVVIGEGVNDVLAISVDQILECAFRLIPIKLYLTFSRYQSRICFCEVIIFVTYNCDFDFTLCRALCVNGDGNCKGERKYKRQQGNEREKFAE